MEERCGGAVEEQEVENKEHCREDHGHIHKRPTVGDINGDDHTDPVVPTVVPTVSGNIYVLSGKDGSKIQPFPYRTHGRIMSPVLLLDMCKHGGNAKGLTLATTSVDGYFYVVSLCCVDPGLCHEKAERGSEVVEMKDRVAVQILLTLERHRKLWFWLTVWMVEMTLSYCYHYEWQRLLLSTQ